MLSFSIRVRAFVGVSLFGLLASVLIPPATAAVEPLAAKAVLSQETSPAEDPVAEAEALAARKAATTGADVVVDALTTPTELVTASPDGTFTKTLTVEPSRMLNNGVWADISTDLIEASGVLRPKMAPANLSLGKGQSQHMSTVGDAYGHSVTESWPYGDLPVPTLKANTATYLGVLPGVDLIQVVKKQGISQVLKIHTPEAARDPRVLGLKLRLDSTNVTFAEDGKGGVTGKSSKDGTDVLRSAKGQWWDSRFSDASATDPGGPGLTRSLDLGLVREGGQVHEKPVLNEIASATGLTYPVYVDPDWSTARASYVYVDSGFPNTSYWNGLYTEGYVNVGFLPGKWDYSYWMNHTTRGYWQFATSPMVGKHIFAARFNATNIWSSSCNARTVRARVTGAVGPGTTWNSQPGWAADLEAKAFAYGNEGAGCGDSTVAFDMMNAAHIFPTVSQWTVGLFADNETWDELSWKRFRNDASITIRYGTPPNKPALTAISGCSISCSNLPGQTGMTRYARPAFTFHGSDPDGDADGAISIWAGIFRPDGVGLHGMLSPLQLPGSGGNATWLTPGDLPDGMYTLEWQAHDPTGLVSGIVRYDFRVDTSAPPAPSIATTSAALGAGMSDANGVVGQSVYGFTLTNPSIDPVKGFIYALTGEGAAPEYPADMSCGQRIKEYTMVCPADGKTASFTAAAITRTNTRITAWAVDEAGNVGTFKKTLNGSTAAFSVGNYAPMPAQGLPVTTVGSATALQIPAGTDGPTGSCTDVADESVPAEFRGAALGLQGGYAATAASAANTANSFTVSGWFCPTAMPGAAPQPVIAQTDSANTVLAELRINTASRWELVTRTSTGATEAVAVGTGNLVAAGSWYFVNAVYDKINRQLRITAANINDVRTWTVATTSDAHAAVPAGSNVLLGASSTTAGTPRFTGFLAGPVLAAGVLVNNQLRQLWATANPTTVTVLK